MVKDPNSPIGATRLVTKHKGEHFTKLESKVQNVEYLAGKTVWVKVDDDEMFVESTVREANGDKLKVNCRGEELEVNLKDCLNSLPDVDPLVVSDMAKLPHANSAVVLKILRERFSQDMIYLLVALNPFKRIPNLYDNSVVERYKKADTTLGFPPDLEPHTYAVGQCAINGLFNDRKNQSCIVSGESGAGKTETAKQLMNFFAYSKANANASSHVQDIILGSNALLESFGNAKTINNNNSSRFGKFLKLNLLPTGGIVGGEMSSYMLEISRVEFQNENERNFHLFYQALKGLSRAELESYRLMDATDYKYLNQSNCYEAPGIDDVADFQKVQAQLKKLFAPDRLANFFQILSGILLCGNVEFVEETRLGVDSAAKVSNEPVFRSMTELLGLDYEATVKAMVEKTIRIQDKVIESAVTPKVAQVNVRALSKDLYGFLFQHIIELLNKFTAPAGSGNADAGGKYVGILDIYGFEYFKYNTYEQLLINFANEKLQKYFINNVFTSELSLYEREKIDASSITYSDNSAILEVFEKKNCGIFPFLYEQCTMESGSAEAFTRSCTSRIKNDFFVPPKGTINEFTVVHTACKVTYSTDEFISKNKHSLSEAVVGLLLESSNELVKEMVTQAVAADLALATSPTSPTGRATRTPTKMFVGNKFLKSINELIKCLEETNSHFIRCVKTNQLKQSGFFDVRGVYGQLNSLSILEAIQIIHKGYAYKAPFANFIKDNQFIYNILIGEQMAEDADPEAAKENVLKMLRLLEIPEGQYQIGLTMVFLKKDGWMMLEQAHVKFSQLMAPLSKLLNTYYFTYANRKAYLRRREAAVRLQSLARRFALVGEKLKKLKLVNELVGFVVVASWLNFENRVLNAALTVQATWRMARQRRKFLAELSELRELQKKRLARKRLSQFRRYAWFCVFGLYLQRLYKVSQLTKAATRIQAAWRMHRCVAAYNHLRYRHLQDYAATVLQKNVRCFLNMKNYEFMRYVVPSVVLIQSHFRGWLVRKFVDSKVELLRSIRLRLRLYEKVYMIQNAIRSVLMAERFKVHRADLATLQSYFWTRCWYVEMTRIMWASDTIKRHWKSYKFRSLVDTQKDELLDEGYKREVQKVTRDEIVRALELLQRHTRGLLPLHVNVSTKLDEFYPNGWAHSLGMVMRLNEDKEVSSVSMGLFHTVVVLDELFVYAFGLNDYNQLGYSSATASRERPGFDANVRLEPIVTIKQGLRVASVSCGLEHTAMLLSDGSVYTWGLNRNGQCAQPQAHEVVATPTLVAFDAHDVKQLSAGNYHVCCLSFSDELFVWGKAFHLGLDCEDLFRPTRLSTSLSLKAVYAGKQVSYLLDREGNVYSFGSTYNGQLGYQASEVTQAPGPGRALAPCTLGKGSRTVFLAENPGAYGLNKDAVPYKFVINRVVDLAVGNNFTVALDVYGNLWQWGTFLVVNAENDQFEQRTEYEPFPVKLERQLLKSPVARVSVGWWEVNLLTESLALYGYNYLRMEKEPEELGSTQKLGTHRTNGKVYTPILFNYPGLAGALPRDVKTLASPTITVTMVKKE